MSTFEIPIKRYVVNDPSQVTIVFQDPLGAPTTVFSTNDHKVFFTPVFTNVRRGEIRVRNRTNPVTAVAQVSTLTFTSGAVAGDNIRIRVVMDDTLDVANEVGELVPLSDSYAVDFVATTTLTSAQLASALQNLLDRPDYPFIATVAGSVITLTGKYGGVRFRPYVKGNNATHTVTTAAVTPVGTYDILKNIYAQSQFDSMFPYGEKLNRPLPGRTYVTYYWEIEAEEKVGGHSQAGLVGTRRTRFMVYVDSTLSAVITELDKILTAI